MNTIDAHALLWSKRSNCFHIEALTDTVAKGRRFFINNMTNDYLLIGLGSREDVEAAAAALRPHMRKRDEAMRACEVGAVDA